MKTTFHAYNYRNTKSIDRGVVSKNDTVTYDMDYEGDVIMEDAEHCSEESDMLLYKTDADGDVIMEDVEHTAFKESKIHVKKIKQKTNRRTPSSKKDKDDLYKPKTKKRKVKNYSEEQIERLLKYYFTDKLTVKEASKRCNMNLSSAYKYVKKMKSSGLQYIIYDDKSRNDTQKRQMNLLLSALRALVV